MRTKIYVAGPYTSEPEANTYMAITVGQELLDLGYAPFVPHLSHFWEEFRSNPWQDWMELDLARVPMADALLRIPGASSGADLEVNAALAAGVPVYYTLEDLLYEVPTEMEPVEPTIPAAVDEALAKLRSVFESKGADYTEDGKWRSNFADVAKQIGITELDAVDVMIAVKQSRLRALRANGRTPLNESTADTYLDRAVYALIALAMLFEDDVI